MKKALKVTFGAMLAVSLAAPLAGQAIPTDIQNHFAVWGDLTYMRPTNNGLSIGDFATIPTDTEFDGARNHYYIDPSNEFDYALGVTYRLHNYRHTRVFLSYDHFRSDEDRQGDTNIRNLGVVPAVIGITFTPTQAVSEYDLHSDEVRLGLIHDLHFGDRFCLDVLAFFEYDRLRQTLTESIHRGTEDFRARETENRVRGWGPGFGFMSRWFAYGPNWHFFAGANTTLLKTDNNFSQRFAVILGDDISGTGYDYEPNESHSLVGKLDIEFGLNYACAFRHEMYGAKWDVSLGMRYMNMFNVFKNGNTMYQPNGGADNTVADNFAAYTGAAQDWGKYGPFLRFKIGGNHS